MIQAAETEEAKDELQAKRVLEEEAIKMVMVQQSAELAKKKEKMETDKGKLCGMTQQRITEVIRTRLEELPQCDDFQLNDPVKLVKGNQEHLFQLQG